MDNDRCIRSVSRPSAGGTRGEPASSTGVEVDLRGRDAGDGFWGGTGQIHANPANLTVRRVMTATKTSVPACAAAAIGAALWYAASLLTGKREPWDAATYWIIAYPLAIITCAVLGYSYPEHPRRWALILFEAQFLAMCVRNGELGNLWPMGMALFGIIALPGVLAARIASRFNSRPSAG
jgi:hypothetical protein